MPYLVNGQPVPEEWIREEEQRLTRDLRFQTIADEAERARQLRVAAEHSAIDRMLVELGAASDPRPVDTQAVEQEVERQKQASNGRGSVDKGALRQSIRAAVPPAAYMCGDDGRSAPGGATQGGSFLSGEPGELSQPGVISGGPHCKARRPGAQCGGSAGGDRGGAGRVGARAAVC